MGNVCLPWGSVVVVVVFHGFRLSAQLYTELPSPREGQGHPFAMARQTEARTAWIVLQTSAHLLRQGRINFCCWGVTKGETTFNAKIASTLIGTSCAGTCHWSHCRGVAFSTSFFKVCSKAKSSLRAGRDQYFCSGGVYADTMGAVSLENQLIVSSGFVSMGLYRRTKTSWAHEMAFCAGILSCPC